MNLDEFLREWSAPGDKLLVHTSGSTGQPKPLWVEKRRMEASARITCQFLGLKPGDTALLCLPLDYIAGKMMVVRALTCGLRLVSLPPSSHPLAQMDGACEAVDFAAMVPLQVWNSLQVPQERQRLMGIRHLIIGGGAIDDALAAELKSFPNAVWSTYGMTETLSHIALRRLSGSDATEWYTPFSGVALALSSEGCLIVDAPLVCPQTLVTNDVAELLPDGRFRILGRRDNVVCSGGIKIQIEEVERLLKPHLAMPFCVTKRKDARLGEALVLLVQSPADIAPLQSICRRVLPRLWKPRRIIGVPRIPLTATGKIARQEAQRMAERE
jgi:O-succinylbenzoic acid--CoA ligase